MKKLALAACSALVLFASPAFAVAPLASGFYLGFNAGYGDIDESVSSASDHTSGLAGGMEGGYKFNRHSALDMGFTHFNDERFENKASGTTAARGDENYILEIAVKGILPLEYGVSLFAEGGAGIVHHHLSAKNGFTVSNTGTHSNLAGYFAAGAAYAFSPRASVVAKAATTTSDAKHSPAMRIVSLGLEFMV